MSELLIAVRCEELPARFIKSASSQLTAKIKDLLQGIEYGDVQSWSTPRRIAVAIKDVKSTSPLVEKWITGPPAAVAFKDGQPTKTAIGFARGKKVDVADLQIIDSKRGPVVGVKIKSGGEKTTDRIKSGLEKAVLGIEFPKTMKWGSSNVKWSRPLHGIIALYNGQRIETTVGQLTTTDQTIGHRLFPAPIIVKNAIDWVQGLREKRVIVAPNERQEIITTQLKSAAQHFDATIKDWDLLDEVMHLVEWPVTIKASFPKELLDLPPKLLVESMKIHQRVFPLYRNDSLMAAFLVVTNQPYASDPKVAQNIAEGNKRVLTARFYDAQFFYAEDRKKPLSQHRNKLKGIRWVRNGGTIWDKSERVAALAKQWSGQFAVSSLHAERAAHLCKADLSSQMVTEFPKLQGHVGRLLAGFDNEAEEVCTAIEEHYLPLQSGGDIAASQLGRLIACADRWDTLSSCFRLGLIPKGSGDPLGIRRAANGFLQTLIHSQTSMNLEQLCKDHPKSKELLAFLLARLRAQFQEHSPNDLINAVMATGDTDPVALQSRLAAMGKLSSTANYSSIRSTFKRVMGLTKSHDDANYQIDLLHEPAEQALHAALQEVQHKAMQAAQQHNYEQALDALKTLKPKVDQLFDSVMVMVDDKQIRANRLGLLRSIANSFHKIADFSLLSTEG